MSTQGQSFLVDTRMWVEQRASASGSASVFDAWCSPPGTGRRIKAATATVTLDVPARKVLLEYGPGRQGHQYDPATVTRLLCGCLARVVRAHPGVVGFEVVLAAVPRVPAAVQATIRFKDLRRPTDAARLAGMASPATSRRPSFVATVRGGADVVASGMCSICCTSSSLLMSLRCCSIDDTVCGACYDRLVSRMCPFCRRPLVE